jgi:hypothetical protein
MHNLTVLKLILIRNIYMTRQTILSHGQIYCLDQFSSSLEKKENVFETKAML